MQLSIQHKQQASSKYQIFLFNKTCLDSFNLEIQEQISKSEEPFITYLSPNQKTCYVDLGEKSDSLSLEKMRKIGFDVLKQIKDKKTTLVSIHLTKDSKQEFAFLEGFILSAYSFEKYKSEKTPNIEIELISSTQPTYFEELKNTTSAVFSTRDLVNEPQSTLNSTAFKNEIARLFENQNNVSCTVLDKKQIEALHMSGLLAVNAASDHPPYFVICEYKPQTFNNSKPVVLVGKGVVYDTGGLSIKPTQNSMDIMKCDMAGAAAVIGALLAVTSNQLPLHVITLIPITDNWIGSKSFAPGDVLKMANGKTVEVMDTDAEGRLILADALIYAQKFNPELVIDLATLTGSAVRAIGQEGIVYMGNTSKTTKETLEQSGNNCYERLVEFPLWEEYFEQIKSSIADIKNLGGPTAGAITAGKFLEQFIDYNWLHLDIAGPAFISTTDSYRGKEATGVGVRLLYDFLKGYNS